MPLSCPLDRPGEPKERPLKLHLSGPVNARKEKKDAGGTPGGMLSERRSTSHSYIRSPRGSECNSQASGNSSFYERPESLAKWTVVRAPSPDFELPFPQAA